MKKLCGVILFAMVLTGAYLTLSAAQAKAGDNGCGYYYIDSFGFRFSSGPYYTHRPGYRNDYNRGYRNDYNDGYYQGYRDGHYDSYGRLPYSYKPYPYWNRPYYYPRPYYYVPRPYYPRWRCWP